MFMVDKDRFMIPGIFLRGRDNSGGQNSSYVLLLLLVLHKEASADNIC